MAEISKEREFWEHISLLVGVIINGQKELEDIEEKTLALFEENVAVKEEIKKFSASLRKFRSEEGAKKLRLYIDSMLGIKEKAVPVAGPKKKSGSWANRLTLIEKAYVEKRFSKKGAVLPWQEVGTAAYKTAGKKMPSLKTMNAKISRTINGILAKFQRDSGIVLTAVNEPLKGLIKIEGKDPQKFENMLKNGFTIPFEIRDRIQ